MQLKRDRKMRCVVCGFVTWSYQDMVEHLAREQEYEVENCTHKLIDFLKETEEDKKRIKKVKEKRRK